MNKIIIPAPSAEQIAIKKKMNKAKKEGRIIFVRDEAHEIELWEQSRLKNAIAGTKKKR